ncbi:hypothetical protein FBU30_004441 [Linnemannia zychae]|nr:hypothetical protein FBU30_004441 [Linnemannia zychae]
MNMQTSSFRVQRYYGAYSDHKTDTTYLDPWSSIIDHGVKVSSFAIGVSPTTVIGNELATRIEKSPLIIDPTKTDAFAALNETFVTKLHYTLSVSGSISAKLESAVAAALHVGDALGSRLGNLTDIDSKVVPSFSVFDIGFQSSVTLVGFNNIPLTTFIN